MKYAPDEYFDDVLALVNREELDYETRLDMLQTWLSRLADGQTKRSNKEEIEGAIIALQARSKLKQDMPNEQPQTKTYGGVQRSNLRFYGLRRILARLRGSIR